MEPITLTHHSDGRTAVADTPTDLVTLRAMGFREDDPVVVEEPSADWSHEELDAHATSRNFDLTGARTKPEKVAAIAEAQRAADEAASASDSTGPHIHFDA